MAQSDEHPEKDDDALDWLKFGPRPLLSRVSMELTIGWGVGVYTPRGIIIIDIDNGDDPWPD